MATTSYEDALREQTRGQRLSDYLREMRREGNIDVDMVALSWRAWNMLHAATSNKLPVPDACPGPDGHMLYTWDLREHHLELEMYANNPAEFFYRNRLSGNLWEFDLDIRNLDREDPIPQEVLQKLSLVFPECPTA